MSRHALIRAALEGLSATRATRLLPAAPDFAGFVVTLHHVLPARSAAFQPNALLAVTPDFLGRFLSYFKGLGWRFVSVDELVGESGGTDPRRIAVTLDDGYRNNLEHALPVFRRHAVPFTIYVCPGFCDRAAELWWEALDRIIAGSDAVDRPDEPVAKMLPAKTVSDKSKAFRLWTEWLTTVADEAEQRVAIRALAAKHGLDLVALARDLVMDWDEVRAIAADPLCSIGAHTMTHPALARLSTKAAFQEIQASADRIAAEIGKRPTSLAFPYGYRAAAGPREAELAAQAGLAASFTTRPGAIHAAGSRHRLPRISINGLFQKLRYLDVLLSPGLWALKDRMRKPS